MVLSQRDVWVVGAEGQKVVQTRCHELQHFLLTAGVVVSWNLTVQILGSTDCSCCMQWSSMVGKAPRLHVSLMVDVNHSSHRSCDGLVPMRCWDVQGGAALLMGDAAQHSQV